MQSIKSSYVFIFIQIIKTGCKISDQWCLEFMQQGHHNHMHTCNPCMNMMCMLRIYNRIYILHAYIAMHAVAKHATHHLFPCSACISVAECFSGYIAKCCQTIQTNCLQAIMCMHNRSAIYIYIYCRNGGSVVASTIHHVIVRIKNHTVYI